jgi:hypothetical protein
MNAFFLDSSLEKQVHSFPESDNIGMTVTPPLYISLDMGKGERVRGFRADVRINIAVVTDISASYRTEHPERNNGVLISLPSFEIA